MMDLSSWSEQERDRKTLAFGLLYIVLVFPTGFVCWYFLAEPNTTGETADRAISELETVKRTIIDEQIKGNHRKISLETNYKIAILDRTLTTNIKQFNQTVMEEINKLVNISDPDSLYCFTKTSIYNRKYLEMVMKLKDCCVSDRLKLLESGLLEIQTKAIGQLNDIFNGLKRKYDVCRELNLKDCLRNVIETTDVAKSEFVQISNQFSNEMSNYGQTFNLDDVDFIDENLKDFTGNLIEFMKICVNAPHY